MTWDLSFPCLYIVVLCEGDEDSKVLREGAWEGQAAGSLVSLLSLPISKRMEMTDLK
jgi:hypothetical protein